MKTLITLFLLLSVSLASATNDTPVTPTVETENTTTIAISTKGVKKLNDIQIETINKTTYLELMLSSKKNKNVKTC